MDDWHHLLILHYLDLADGTPLSHQLMAFGDLPSGMVRGGGFDRQSEQDLGLRLGHAPQAQVERACRALGGVLTPSNADVCAVFSLFPNYPITLKLWFADEEIPGSGRLFLDRSASHYLTVEDAVTAGSVLMETLVQELNAHCLIMTTGLAGGLTKPYKGIRPAALTRSESPPTASLFTGSR